MKPTQQQLLKLAKEYDEMAEDVIALLSTGSNSLIAAAASFDFKDFDVETKGAANAHLVFGLKSLLEKYEGGGKALEAAEQILNQQK